MDFSWKPEQVKRYEETVAFADTILKGAGPEFSRAIWKKCGDFGLLGLPVDPRYGGQGQSALTTARLMEALGRGSDNLGFVFSLVVNLCACTYLLQRMGSEEQKARWLPKLCAGDWVGAMAITEPDSGSDAFSMKTSAVREGEHYLLSGEKAWVTNAPVADFIVVYAVTQPSFGHLGISAIGLEASSPGLVVGRRVSTMGLQGAPISGFRLEACRVPVGNRIGKDGAGAAAFKASMMWERTCTFATYLGVMEGMLERTIAFAKKRSQFKRPIGQNQGVSHKIADMRLRLDSARLLLYRACWLVDQGADAELEVSMAKLAISEAAVQSALDAIQIHGGVGYAAETGIEHALRDAIPSTIFSGTSEMQRNIIASRLGL